MFLAKAGFEKVRRKMSLENESKMHDNELGQTRTNWKVNNLNVCRYKFRRTRRVIIFPKFTMNSALFKIVEVHFNGQETERHIREVHGA